MNANVTQLLRNKDIQGVISICPQASTYEALEIMAKHDIGAVAVIENEKIVGILSERDYARKVILEGRTSTKTSVMKTMTTKLVKITTSTTLQKCTELMTLQRVRYLAVMKDKQFITLISIGDVVKAIMVEQQSDIKNLQEYIQGKAS